MNGVTAVVESGIALACLPHLVGVDLDGDQVRLETQFGEHPPARIGQ